MSAATNLDSTWERHDLSRPRRSALAESLDGLLEEPPGAAQRCAAIAFQAELIAASEAVLVEFTAEGVPTTLGFWPAAANSALLASTTEIAAQADRTQAIVCGDFPDEKLTDGADSESAVAQPIVLGGKRLVAVYRVASATPFVLALAIERLELAGRIVGDSATSTPAEISLAIELLASLSAAETFDVLANVLCSEVANRFEAERVALALDQRDETIIVARNHSTETDAYSWTALELAERGRVCSERNIEQVSDDGDSFDVPVRNRGEACGAVVIDRKGRPISEREAAVLRLIVDLASPRLLERYLADRPLFTRLRDALRGYFDSLFEPRNTAGKLVGVAVILSACFLAFADGTLRIETPFVIAPTETRVVSAPFDGTLALSEIEPGDTVVAGETVLASLETEDLELERSRARAEILQALKEADVARTSGSPASEQVARYAAESARATVSLLDARLADASLVAPVNGIVLEGDLAKRIGGPVARGEILVRVAPLDALRAELSVREEDIGWVEIGQRGEIAPASNPGEHIAFEIIRIDPLAVAGPGSNTFRVIAALDGNHFQTGLLPGVAGIAKIESGQGSYFWLWTRELWNAVRLALWI